MKIRNLFLFNDQTQAPLSLPPVIFSMCVHQIVSNITRLTVGSTEIDRDIKSIAKIWAWRLPLMGSVIKVSLNYGYKLQKGKMNFMHCLESWYICAFYNRIYFSYKLCVLQYDICDNNWHLLKKLLNYVFLNWF